MVYVRQSIGDIVVCLLVWMRSNIKISTLSLINRTACNRVPMALHTLICRSASSLASDFSLTLTQRLRQAPNEKVTQDSKFPWSLLLTKMRVLKGDAGAGGHAQEVHRLRPQVRLTESDAGGMQGPAVLLLGVEAEVRVFVFYQFKFISVTFTG